MKSMTYAQKADLAAKCKRVFESVKRSNQVAMVEKYKDLAVKAIGYDRYLRDDTLTAFFNMKTAIKNKPRYRYDSKAGEWVQFHREISFLNMQDIPESYLPYEGLLRINK